MRRRSRKLGEPWRRGIEGERDLLEAELLELERDERLDALLDERNELEKLRRLRLVELAEDLELLRLCRLFSLSRDALESVRDLLRDFFESERLRDLFDAERLLLLDWDFFGECEGDFFEHEGDLEAECFDRVDDLDLCERLDLAGDFGERLAREFDLEREALSLEADLEHLSLEEERGERRRGDRFPGDGERVYDLESDREYDLFREECFAELAELRDADLRLVVFSATLGKGGGDSLGERSFIGCSRVGDGENVGFGERFVRDGESRFDLLDLKLWLGLMGEGDLRLVATPVAAGLVVVVVNVGVDVVVSGGGGSDGNGGGDWLGDRTFPSSLKSDVDNGDCLVTFSVFFRVFSVLDFAQPLDAVLGERDFSFIVGSARIGGGDSLGDLSLIAASSRVSGSAGDGDLLDTGDCTGGSAAGDFCRSGVESASFGGFSGSAMSKTFSSRLSTFTFVGLITFLPRVSRALAARPLCNRFNVFNSRILSSSSFGSSSAKSASSSLDDLRLTLGATTCIFRLVEIDRDFCSSSRLLLFVRLLLFFRSSKMS